MGRKQSEVIGSYFLSLSLWPFHFRVMLCYDRAHAVLVSNPSISAHASYVHVE